jgi:hypothetical protein
MEDRWDFTEADGLAFPIYINQGGGLYGFCPSKVARDDHAVVQVFQLLMIAAETGAMLKTGGLEDQPDWFVEMLGWLIPRLDLAKFSSKAMMVMGGSGGSSSEKTKALFTQLQSTAKQGSSRGGNSRPTTR